MSWRDQLRPASFRGVSFKVDASSAKFGRVGIVHEYAQRDTPAVEDGGRLTRPFGVGGFVIGPDYLIQRDRLIQAAETPGPGVLIHPTYGRLTVFCLELSIDESADSRGSAAVAFRFVEAGQLRFPTAGATGAARATAGAAELKTQARADFVEAFDTSGAGFQAAEAIEQVDRHLADLRNAFNAPDAILDDAFAVVNTLNRLSTDLAALVQTPGDLADRIVALVEAVQDFGAAFAFLRRPSAAVRTRTGANTDAEAQAETNAKALAALFNRLALVLVAQELNVDGFGSRQDAEAFLGSYAAFSEVEELRQTATSDRTYSALVDARTGVYEAVSKAAVNLPSLVTVDASDGYPAIVLSYELYGSPERDREIVDRNGALVPLSLAGSLRVLSR